MGKPIKYDNNQFVNWKNISSLPSAGMLYPYPLVYVSPKPNADGEFDDIMDITNDVNDGARYLYNSAKNASLRFYRSKDGRHYYQVFSNTENPDLRSDVFDEISYSQLKKALPKRDYIGGNKTDSRALLAQKIPGFTEYIYNRAKAYNLDPNLLINRVLREGFDKIITDYNAISAVEQEKYLRDVWTQPYSGYNTFGLDDAASHLQEGRYELLDPNASWEEEGHTNEHGRLVHSVRIPDLKSAVEIMAAELNYRKGEMKKKYKLSDADLNIYTNASYPLGVNHKDLNNADFIRREYTYPDYYGKYKLKYSEGGNLSVIRNDAAISTAERRARIEALIKRINETGNADFVRRLLDEKKKKILENGGGIKKVETEYKDILPESRVTATLPSIHSSKGKEIAKRIASRIISGDVDWSTVPLRYRSYIEGEVKGGYPVTRAINTAGVHLSPIVIGLSAGPVGAISAIAGQAVDAGVNVATGGEKRSWGDLLVNSEKHPVGSALAEITNPAYISTGLVKGFSGLRNAIQNDRKAQKALLLYNYGRNPRSLNLLRNVNVDFRAAANKVATRQKPFTPTQKRSISQHVLSSEVDRAERLFGDRKLYRAAFNKHAQTPELKKIFKENPEYLYYIEHTGKSPLEQETLDAFAQQQMRSVRGVHLDKATPASIEQSMTEFGRNIGGDRLNTNGGVYSSNSYAMADHYSRPIDNSLVDNVISELQYTAGNNISNARKQLSLLRDNVLARDDWYESTNVLLHEQPPLLDYTFVESPYATRRGSKLNVFERATTKPQSVESMQTSVRHGLPDMHGRWGINGVPVVSGDDRLFIPKVTTRADLKKILSGGRIVYDKDMANDYLSTIANQNKNRISLIENSLPYKIGDHIYKNTGLVGGHKVYSPLLGVVGAGAIGGGALGLISIGNHLVRKANAKAQKEYDEFRQSPYYDEFISAGGGPELYDEYFSRFKKGRKSASEKNLDYQK